MISRIQLRHLICLLPLATAFEATALESDAWGMCQSWPRPVLDYPGTERGENAPTFVSADASESHDNQVVKLFGDVRVQRPDEQLRADTAIYHHSDQSLDASGNVRFETTEFSTISDQAHVIAGTRQGSFEMAEFFIYTRHARGSSHHLQLEGEDLTILKQASYTTCDKIDEDWTLRASTVELDHAAGMGNAYNTRLYFQGLPVFYLPFMRFPITDARMTGLLPPSWGSSDQGGNDFALPIYLNLHPQLDATLIPHNYTERGMKWETELRYLSRYGEGIINSENLDDEVYGQKRSLYHYKHSSQLSQNWTGDILFSRVSDQDYFTDFGTSLSTSSTSYLERYLQLQYSDDMQQLLIQTQDYQIINRDLAVASRPYRRLPQIEHQFNPNLPGPVRFEMTSEIVRFQRQDSLSGSRTDINPSLSLPYQRMAGFIIPKLSLHQSYYNLDLDSTTLDTNNIQRTVPVNSLDTGIYLERETDIGVHNYVQTLEPRLFYLYVPYRDQSDIPLFDTTASTFSQSQLYSDSRFDGLDRIGDTNQVTVSLATRLLRADNGREKFYASIGKIVYLDDRQVGLNGNVLDTSHQSDIIAEAQFRPSDAFSLKTTLLWDTESELITERDIRLQFMSDNQHIFNFRYHDLGNRLTAPDSLVQEIDTSILWPLTPRWSMMARRYHSLNDDRTLEKMAGFEYNSCCWAFRAVRRANFVTGSTADTTTASTTTQLNYSWYLQLELKGLTSLGKRIEELMQDQILGFDTVN